MGKDSVVDLYERHTDAYDRDRGRSLQERAWLDRFLSHVPPEGTVRDVGCGMGEPIARYLIARGLHVVGVDARFASQSREGAALMFTSGTEEGEAIGSWCGEPL